MTVTEKFSNLTKIPKEPAAKLLALNNMKLEAVLAAPASAPVDVVLSELSGIEDSGIDMLRVLASILPPRERVWWSCLAARDIVGPGTEKETRSLKAAEAWVFRPSEESRNEAIASLEHADMNDLTVHCAMGVMYCDDTLGTGEMAQFASPPGAGAIAAFAMNVEALAFQKDIWDEHLNTVIDRALDIARGGNGKPGKGTGS
jgi:hypothetical protein